MIAAGIFHSEAIAAALATGPGHHAELLLRALAYKHDAGRQPVEHVLRAVARELLQGVDAATWASDSQLAGLDQLARSAAVVLAADWIASADPAAVAFAVERILKDTTSP